MCSPKHMGSYFRPKVRVDRNRVPNSHEKLASMRIDPHALSLMNKSSSIGNLSQISNNQILEQSYDETYHVSSFLARPIMDLSSKNNEISPEKPKSQQTPISIFWEKKINNTYKAQHRSYVLDLFCSLEKVHELREFHFSCPK